MPILRPDRDVEVEEMPWVVRLLMAKAGVGYEYACVRRSTREGCLFLDDIYRLCTVQGVIAGMEEAGLTDYEIASIIIEADYLEESGARVPIPHVPISLQNGNLRTD